MNKPFLIAELSCNHKGSIERALELVAAAAEAGADGIKLQTWQPKRMVADPHYVIESGPWAGRNLAALYEEAYTPWRWHPKIFAVAKRLGMVGFSTPFDTDALEFLEQINCPMYKIASFEIVDLELIKAVARTGKPMIMSTGMANPIEIGSAALNAHDAGCRDVTLLKCTSSYPADASDANLRTMQYLSCFPRVTAFGLSDHTQGVGVAVAAAALGASVIEKHFTLRRSDGGPDAAFSMEPDEFKTMVVACRQAAAAIGEVTYGPLPSEAAQLALRRSLHIAKDLPAGHVITSDDIVSARPANGMHCHHWPAVMGAMLARNVCKGEPTSTEMFKS